MWITNSKPIVPKEKKNLSGPRKSKKVCQTIKKNFLQVFYSDRKLFIMYQPNPAAVTNMDLTFVDGCDPPIRDCIGFTPFTGLPPAPAPGDGGSDGGRE